MSFKDFGQNALNVFKKPAAILGLTAMSILGAGSMNDAKAQNVGKRTGTDTTQTDHSASEDAPRSYKVDKPKSVTKPQRDLWIGGVGASFVPDFTADPMTVTPKLYWYGITPGFISDKDKSALSPNIFARGYVSLAGRPIGGSANYQGYGISSYSSWSYQSAVSGFDIIAGFKKSKSKEGNGTFIMFGATAGTNFFGYNGNEFNATNFHVGGMFLASVELFSFGDHSSVNLTAGADWNPLMIRDKGAYDYFRGNLVGEEERNPSLRGQATISLSF